MDEANFNIVNDQIKAFITTYQENPFITPIKRITSLHKRLAKSLRGVEDIEVKNILEKMENALNEILAGNEGMLHSTETDSYHMLLWKIHQYLIKAGMLPAESWNL